MRPVEAAPTTSPTPSSTPAPRRTRPKPRPKPTKTVRARPRTDPRFSTCAAARRAGYGPYRAGQTEYSWYQDRDGDGVVCE
ncbi:excalibur calcium-binding domain-containing protein [Actinomadura pelletieri]|uniref:excalibur calcium-binding domain-containing protein n=1 Tax=Actinomadura pelletieri TaxID=111805 RepID=UPI003B59BFE4